MHPAIVKGSMIKNFTHTWHYSLANSGNSFSLYFNERLVAIIIKPASGKWPVHVNINEKMYVFTKRGWLPHTIEIKDAITGEAAGMIHMPFFSSLRGITSFVFPGGESFTWYSNNFFSFHWKWKKGTDTIIDAIDNLSGKKNNGVIVINEYKSGSDLLIAAGFFLSLLRRSRFTFGIRGLRRRIQFTKTRD